MIMLPERTLEYFKECKFPKLRRDRYTVTSRPTYDYNCIAYAAGCLDEWWWPVVGNGVVWPDNIPQEETIACFADAYRAIGYVECADATLIEGVEKVVLYADADGYPTHAARQLESGRWTSKLGEWEDIEHASPEDLEDENDQGLGYGKVVLVMQRSRK